MPESRAVETVHLGALAQLSVQREEPLHLVLLEVGLPSEGVHQLGLLLPDDLADLGHPAEVLFWTACGSSSPAFSNVTNDSQFL